MQRALDSIVRLRRAERSIDDQAMREIEPVVSYLEDIVGPTVSRAEAARLPGISHTALDRWIDKGDISAVLTPEGRREIPLAHLVDLLDQLEEKRDEGRLALASLIRDRRRRAEAIEEDELLPARRRGPSTHRTPELQALAYHRVVHDECRRSWLGRFLEAVRRRLPVARQPLEAGSLQIAG